MIERLLQVLFRRKTELVQLQSYPKEEVQAELERARREVRELNERVRYNRRLMEQWKHSYK